MPVLLLTEVNAAEVDPIAIESKGINLTVAPDTGVLSDTSRKIPFIDCAFAPEEIIPASRKQNKNLSIEIVITHWTFLICKTCG